MSNSLIQNELDKRLSPPVRQPDGTFVSTILFDADFPGFDGHFPDNPIVPAICQLSAVELLVRNLAGRQNLRLAEIVHLKFKAPLFPGTIASFTIAITDNPDGTCLVNATVATDKQPNAAKLKLRLQ